MFSILHQLIVYECLTNRILVFKTLIRALIFGDLNQNLLI